MARADSGRREYHDRWRDYYGAVSGKITNYAAKERGSGSAADRLFWTSGRDCSECKAK